MSLPKGMLGDRSRQPLTHSVDMPLVIVGDVPDASADLAAIGPTRVFPSRARVGWRVHKLERARPCGGRNWDLPDQTTV